MFGPFASLASKLYVRWLQRDQHRGLKIREYFRTKHRLDVGLYSYGCFDEWRMRGPIRIGRYCSIANTVRSVPINHKPDAMTTHPVLYEKAFGAVDQDVDQGETLVIEDDVWIAHNVVILPACKFIGRGAIIGAGAIVTKNVDRYAIVAGNPARKLRDRFSPEMIAAIEASRWWELDFDQFRKLVRTRGDMVFNPTSESIAAWISETERSGSASA